MNELLHMISKMDLNSPCDIDELQKIEKYIEQKLPSDYVEFMKLHNGGEGPVGEYGYLAIWDTNEIIDTNIHRKYFIPISELLYFASDRSGLLYAFDTRNDLKCILELPEDAESYTDTKKIATSFLGFIQYIYDIDDSEFGEAQ